MGVVLTAGIVVMVIMTGFEIYVHRALRPEKYKPEDYWFIFRPVMWLLFRLGPWVEKSTVNSLIFSITLSIALTWIYPIAGLAAFVGGIGSTLLIQPYYQAIRLGRKVKDVDIMALLLRRK